MASLPTGFFNFLHTNATQVMSEPKASRVCPHPGCEDKSFSSRDSRNKHVRTQHSECPPECQFCCQTATPKRQSDPQKKLCQHQGPCPRKSKPFPDTDGARKHEQRTKHFCPQECPLCNKKLDSDDQQQRQNDIRVAQEEQKKDTDQQIRFQSLIRNNRKPASAISKAEMYKRQKEAEALLPRIFGCSSYEEALACLFKGRHKQAPLIRYLETEKKTLDGLVKKHTPEPSLRELLGLKDKLYISDSRWSYVVKTFSLERGTVARLRRVREDLNAKADVQPTANGAMRSIDDILISLFTKTPPTSNVVRVKFAFDGCRITKNINEVIGILARLDGNKEDTKSSSNCHQFLVYVGTETYTEYQEEMKDIIPVLNQYLRKERTIKVDDKEYVIDPYLVVDMKSLCTILGLYNVFHPSTKYCCCWCAILRTLMTDWEACKKEPMRDIQELKKVGKVANDKDTSYASTHEGIRAEPLLDFPLHRIIPCTLHLMMAITKKLFSLLINDMKTVAAKEAVLALCATLKIKLWIPKKSKAVKKTYLLQDIIKKSRLQRTQWIAIIHNYEKFLDLYETHSRLNTSKVRVIWELYVPMISRVCSIDTPEDTIQSWDSLGRQFLEVFVDRYTPEKFTPYMHVFVSHIGFFLKEYKEIESFANYDIETKNADNKAFIHRGSNRFGGVEDRSGIAMQQLQREFRMQDSSVILQPKEKQSETTGTKRKADTDESNLQNKRQRTAGWAATEIQKVDSVSFAFAKFRANTEKLLEEMQQMQAPQEDLVSQEDLEDLASDCSIGSTNSNNNNTNFTNDNN